MTDLSASQAPVSRPRKGSLLTQDALTRKRNAAEARFKAYGIAGIVLAMAALAALLFSIITAGLPAFQQTFLTIPIELPADKLDKAGNRNPAEMAKVTTVGYAAVITTALEAAIEAKGIDTRGMDRKQISGLVSQEAAAELRRYVLANPQLVGTTLPDFEVLANGRIDGFFKGRVTMQSAEADSNVTPEQLMLAQDLSRSRPVGQAVQLGLHHDAGCLGPAAGSGRSGRGDPRDILHDDRRACAVASHRCGRLRSTSRNSHRAIS